MSFFARVAAVSPFGPILAKELRVTSRRKRSYILRVGYLGLLLLALLIAYSATGRSWGGVAQQAQRQAELGYSFFIAFTMFCVGSMGFIGPVLTSNAIGAEKLAKTLPVLLMTPINAWQVVAGKLFSRVLTALTLIGLSLPVLALVRLLGGVELEQMLAVIAIAVSYVIACAAIGLFFSLFINRAAFVILLSYLVLGIIYLLLPGLIAVAIGRGSGSGRGGMTFIAAINPLFSAGLLCEPRARGFVGDVWIWTVGLQLALASGLVAWTAILLRRQFRNEGERASAGPIPAMAEFAPMPPPIVTPLPVGVGGEITPPPVGLTYAPPSQRAAKPAREVSDNPVLWREVRRPLARHRWQRILSVLLTLIILGLVYLIAGDANGLNDARTQIAFSFGFCLVWWLLAAVLSGTAISQEKESDTWTLLLASPLSGKQIVWGKAAGLLRRMLWPTILITAHFLLFAITGVIPIWAVFFAVWMIVACNCLWIATGIYLSLRMKRVTFAVIANLLLGVFVYGLVPIIVAIPASLLRHNGGRAWQEAGLLHQPYTYLVSGFEGMHRWNRSYDYRSNIINNQAYYDDDVFQNYDMPVIGRIKGTEFYTMAFTCTAVHLLIAYLLLSRTAANFDEIVGRAGPRRFVGTFETDETVLMPPGNDGQSPIGGLTSSAASSIAAGDEQLYASFPRRFAAWCIDTAIVQLACIAVGLVIALVEILSREEEDMSTRAAEKLFLKAILYAIGWGFLVGWVYNAAMEGSKRRATLGKSMMGIFVTNLQGGRISAMQAIGRYPAKILSAIPLLAGFLMATVSPRRQALHDVLAGTVVLRG